GARAERRCQRPERSSRRLRLPSPCPPACPCARRSRRSTCQPIRGGQLRALSRLSQSACEGGRSPLGPEGAVLVLIRPPTSAFTSPHVCGHPICLVFPRPALAADDEARGSRV